MIDPVVTDLLPIRDFAELGAQLRILDPDCYREVCERLALVVATKEAHAHALHVVVQGPVNPDHLS